MDESGFASTDAEQSGATRGSESTGDGGTERTPGSGTRLPDSTSPGDDSEDEPSGDASQADRAPAEWDMGILALSATPLRPGTAWGGGVFMRVAPAGGPTLRLSVTHAVQHADTADFAWTALGGAACFRHPVVEGTLSAFPCALVQGGRLSASGRDLDTTRSVNRAWWAAGAELDFRLRLGDRYFVELGGFVVAPLVERSFTVGEPAVELGATAIPTAGGHLGLGFTLGPVPASLR